MQILSTLSPFISKSKIISLTIAHILGTVLLLMAATDLFTHGPEIKFLLLFGLLILFNTSFIISLWIAYIRKTKKGLS